jgi:hypothetical protein
MFRIARASIHRGAQIFNAQVKIFRFANFFYAECSA